MSALTAAEGAFLENPFVGVVTTLQRDGSPQSTVDWVDVDDEGVSINTAHGRVKPRNLEHDPRLSLVVVDPNDPYRWFKVLAAGSSTRAPTRRSTACRRSTRAATCTRAGSPASAGSRCASIRRGP